MPASHKGNGGRKKQTATLSQVTKSQSDDLTCSEGQVEDLLSEGESTGEEGSQPPKRTSRKSASAPVLHRKQA